jgi:anthranilate synthase/aminodeoxychorismate synthase-like glutamine amidotransferase
MILLIDNYDSFTYNLYQLIGSLGFDVIVKKHDEITVEDVRVLRPEKIVISPGPKRPEDSGISMDVISHFYKTVPILGVCLGHQCIGQLFGVKVIHAKEVLHGKTSEISHDGKGIFEGIKNPFSVARYHSLAIEKVPEEFDLRAWADDKEIMAIQHKKYPLYGIQFHPESFMTEQGDLLMKNFFFKNYEI